MTQFKYPYDKPSVEQVAEILKYSSYRELIRQFGEENVIGYTFTYFGRNNFNYKGYQSTLTIKEGNTTTEITRYHYINRETRDVLSNPTLHTVTMIGGTNE